MVDGTADVAGLYRERLDRFNTDLLALQARWSRLADARFVAAALAALLAGIAIYRDLPVLFVGSAVALVAFGALILWHRRLAADVKRLTYLVEINRAALARQPRDWAALPLRSTWEPDANHPFASDIDLFGYASLFHLLDTTTTPMGSGRLRDWLLIPALPDEVQQRQPAVQELAEMLDWRQELAVRGGGAEQQPGDIEAFLEWAEGPALLSNRLLSVWLARLSTAAIIMLAMLDLLQAIGPPLWIVPALLNMVLYLRNGPAAAAAISTAHAHHAALDGYQAMLAHLDTTTFAASWLQEVAATLQVDDSPAHARVARLHRIASWAIPPGSLLHLPAQLLAWDIHLLDALERWQEASGVHVRQWLDAIGQFEAISALANLSFDNPAWQYPTVETGAATVTGTQLGHPLIAATHRVNNDVTVGPAGTFLMVTGSNMSGKSTLLRAIGLNQVLAGCGSVVCAASMATLPVELWTSARIRDSLAQGVSFYMAELLRLKRIVDAAAAASPKRPVLYLLDEILQGTNTTERHFAATHVIATLIDSGALGAVSTHDLDLASEPALIEAAELVHFSETVSEIPGQPAMTFDYLLRPGVATSTNAIRLMQLVGFDIAPGD